MKKDEIKKTSKKSTNNLNSKSNVQKYKLDKKRKIIDIDKFRENIKKNKTKIFIVLVAIVVILLLILIIWGINFLSNYLRMKKFEKYESKVMTYGFDKLYKDNDISTEKSVTRIEAVKLAVGTMLNTTDISGMAQKYDGYEDETWVKYAEFFGISEIGEVTEENKDDEITYEELVRYFSKAKESFTESKIVGTKDVVVKNAANYDISVQSAFSDFVESKLIQIETNNIDVSQKTFKGLLNELVVNSLEQMYLISNYKERLRNTELPSNSNDYPYVLFDIPTKVYNYEFIKEDKNEFISPNLLYRNLKDMYSIIINDIESFYENLYTIDYTNLKASDTLYYLNKDSESIPLLSDMEDYCNFAIKNKIKIETVAKLIEPCIYFDGKNYRARVELKIKINSPNTKENLLFGDSKFGKITYNANEYTIYFDTKFGYSKELGRIYVNSPYGLINEALNKSDLQIKIEK